MPTHDTGLEQGVVVWKDSPLVLALQYGRILMVDEADKAPTEVMCVTVVLQWCYSGVTVVLQRYYSSVTEVLQRC